MAFILHLLDAEHVQDAEQARNFIDQQHPLAPAVNPKFRAFVDDISSTYPDLSEDDLDGDDERNLWEEGLDSEASYGQVKELVVKSDLADEAMLDALVQAAARNGLKLYDSEGMVLYPIACAEERAPQGRAVEHSDQRSTFLSELNGVHRLPEGLRFDGVYQGPRQRGWRSYYRFWPDGSLFQIDLEHTNPMRAAYLLRPGSQNVASGSYEVRGPDFRGETHAAGVSYRIGGKIRTDELMLYRTRADGEEPFSAVFSFVPFEAQR